MAKKAATKKTAKTKKTENPRVQRLEEAFKLTQKTFGAENVFLGSRGGSQEEIEMVPTGSATLDYTSGVGGFPRGRIIEVYGPEASGKTTLAIHAIAEAQKQGLTCAFIDAEHSLDSKYAKKVGVNMDELLIAQPDYGEQAISMIEELSQAKVIDVVVLDSVAALIPKAELEGNLDKAQVGVHARLMSKTFRRITGVLKKSNVLCLMINQTRTNVGVMYGNPEVTTGGNALKFYASMRIRVSRTDKIVEDGKQIGHMLKVVFKKNKMAPPFTECLVPLKYGIGFDVAGDTLTIATELGIVDIQGRSYFFEGEKFATSKGDAMKAVATNKDLLQGLLLAVEAERNKVPGEEEEKLEEMPEGDDVTEDVDIE